MRKPLMPKATASWLIENTALSFKQISDFVGLHILEVQAIADGEVSSGILARNPLETGDLTEEEIKKCEKNEKLDLKIKNSEIPMPQTKTKGAKYTPLSKRADKPNGIYWLIKNYPSLPDSINLFSIFSSLKSPMKKESQNFFALKSFTLEKIDVFIPRFFAA